MAIHEIFVKCVINNFYIVSNLTSKIISQEMDFPWDSVKDFNSNWEYFEPEDSTDIKKYVTVSTS